MAHRIRPRRKRSSIVRRLSHETLEKRELLAVQVCVADLIAEPNTEVNALRMLAPAPTSPSVVDSESLPVLSTNLLPEGEAGETALDRYVAKADPSYAWALTSTIVSPGLTTYVIDMTSQTWRSAAEVDKPLWQHWVQIIVPDNTVNDTALLMISGGSNQSSAPTQSNSRAAAFALQTNQVIVSLPMVPSQSLVFADETRSRSEDEIIAYSYDKFLDGGDEEWPVLLPMVKSAVRAMDTAQDFLNANTSIEIADFFVTGASKRGWTTWLTAAVDQRVVGIVPTVIDVLNMQPSIANHRSNYTGVTNGIIGGYAEAIHDYTELGIFDRFDTPRGVELAEIVDPYSYRDRYTMPKYILNSAGDQFFTPDSSQFYIHDLPGPTYMRYVPNTGHGLNADAAIAAGTFVALVDAGVPLPQYDWTVEGPDQNLIRVNTVQPPTQVNLWQASNPNSLDFRMFIQSTGTFGPVYTSTPLTDQGGGEYVGTVPVPDSGGTAFFVELVYNVFGQTIRFTTEARIARANGPALLAIRPDAGGLLNDGDTLHVAPREFNLLFHGGANLDPTTISTDTVKLVRSGGDGSFAENNEIEVAVGYVGLIDPNSNDPADRQRLVLRPASSAAHNATDPAYALPDDLYQIQIIGSGANPLTNLVGTPFNDGNDFTSTFRLDRGAQVVAVVPQPISLGPLSQASDQIVVYFDDQLLDAVQVVDPRFYRLVNTRATLTSADDSIDLPQSVSYDPQTNSATLTFATDIPEGTYRLDVGHVRGNDSPIIQVGTLADGSPFVDRDDNSTVGSAIQLGQFGSTGIRISSRIEPQSIPLPPWPGSEDEPGHRQIQREQHIGATGTTPTLPQAITTRRYHFPAAIGTDPSGQPYLNLITEAEKQIVREIYEIYAQLSGFEFIESTSGGGTSIGKGDLRALVPSIGPNSGVAGLGGAGAVVLNGAIWNQADRFYGDGFTDTMFHEIGHAIGLGHAYDQPANMGAGVPNDVLPGDHDVVHLQRIKPPNSTDIDMYQFELVEPGRLQAETIAERLATPSLLNTRIALYQQIHDDVVLVAQNDQYYGADSWLDLWLDSGTYFIGVTSTGNSQYDPRVPNSGYGGTTDGVYDLQIAFTAASPNGALHDINGTAFDGDADGVPGGVYSFWFQASDEVTTIFVDKANDSTVGSVDGSGSIADPWDNIRSGLQQAGSRIVVPVDGATSIVDGEAFSVDDGVTAVTFRFGTVGPNAVDISGTSSAAEIAGVIAAAINSSGLSSDVNATVAGRVVQIAGIENLNLSAAPTLLNTPNLVRIVGNGGSDGDLSTLENNRPYLIGLDTNGNALADGADFLVPQGVTVMIAAGAILKLRKANLDVGTSNVDSHRNQSAIQVLGTPAHKVYLRSFHDDLVGGNSNGSTQLPASGDFGGIVFRDDSDLEASGVFLNYVNHADIQHAGGKVFVGAIESAFNSIHIIDARPTISFNHIASGASAAVSASPDSFQETNGRIGPDVVGNFLAGNSIDGMFIRVTTPLGSTLNKLTVSGRLDDTDITHVLTENLIINGGAGGPILDNGTLRARPGGRLLVDPGIVLKLSDARIELERGSGSLIAEGTPDRPVIFTSLDDDRYGGSGAFDSNSSPNSVPLPGDWGGLYFGHATFGSLDHATIAFAGGITPIEGGATNFNAVEIHQADVRIASSLLQHNAAGNASGLRNGRGSNFPATIYVRGSQPIIVDNIITDNAGPAVNINANSLRFEGLRDPGRSTGLADSFVQFADNHGPLVRLNRLDNNLINGMVIRGEEMTTEGIWDDTDIVHVVLNEITVGNHHTHSGLTLQSSSTQSLVVKFDNFASPNAGLTATGTPVEIIDRVGGTIHILGTVGHPVVLTHIDDDSVGAGFTPSGQVMFNTNTTTGASGAWRGLLFDEFSNDRNVAVIRELERPLTGGLDVNSTPFVSQLLGTLAPNETSGDENRRLGFEVTGYISPDDPGDIDVYSFTATAGTGIWMDVDRTDTALDAIIEVVSVNGIVLARSMRSGDLSATGTLNAQTLTQSPFLGGDHYTQNFRDPGLYYVLPGTPGQVGTYFVRIRSNPANAGSVTSFAGESRGAYSLQIRMNQVQEFPGSTVQFADIRYAQTGIDVRGLPAHSPLVGEAGELAANNDTIGSAQVLVNLLETDIAALAIAGELSSDIDIDWYQFDLQQTGVQVIDGVNDSAGTVAVVFDIDYSDGAVRGDTTIAVFDALQRLIYIGRESNVTDDQSTISGGNSDNLSRGSLGKKDPYIGPIHLSPGGSYFVAVMSDQQLPAALTGVFQADPVNPANALVRLEPVNSVMRVVEDHIGVQGYTSGAAILPATPAGLFDISSGVVASGFGVDAHVTPFTLQDVVLYVATDMAMENGDHLYTVDPFQSNTFKTRVTDSLIDGNNVIQDIVIRSDGRMFGYQQSDTSIGALVELDPSNIGTILSTQNDNIAGIVGQPAALTFQRTGTTGLVTAPVPTYDIYYAVSQDIGGGVTTSALYRATEIGDATDRPTSDGNPRYGLVGDLSNVGMDPTTAVLQISDGIAPATTSIRLTSKRPVSSAAPILLNITQADNGNVVMVDVTDTTIHLEIGLMDLSPLATAPTAQQIVDAINGDPAASDLVIAQIDSGNGSQQAVQIPISTLTLKSDIGLVTGLAMGDFAGRTGLFGVTDQGEFLLIDQDSGKVLRRLNVNQALGVNIAFTGLTLGPQNVENGAYKNTLFASTTSGQLFALDTERIYDLPINIIYAPSGPLETFDLLPQAGDPNLSVTGLVISGDTNGGVIVTGSRVTVDPSAYAALPPGVIATITLNYTLSDFAGTTIPQVATISIGDTAVPTANPAAGLAAIRQIFDADGDGIAESFSATVSGMVGTPVGLAFSPLDFNLWHPTTKRGMDIGHGINQAPDNTRAPADQAVQIASPGNIDRASNEALGGASFHFGFEQWLQDPTATSLSYLTYDPAINAQFGILNTDVHSDLSSNASIVNTYNFPGGGYGSLTTNSFSLSGATRGDRPTLYFNYFLETESHPGSTVESNESDPFRDSARVFASRDGGITWELLATNNSQLSDPNPKNAAETAELPGFLSHLSDAGLNSATPRAERQQIVQEMFNNTTAWRQTRVDLSTFASASNVILRFDFSTAGAIGDPSLGETDVSFGELTSDTRSIRSLNNAFEGFYIDDIIVGYAERGEMVTGVLVPDAIITNLFAPGARTSDPDLEANPDILRGHYQLEIRRTGEYVNAGDEVNSIAAIFDTNARHIQASGATGLLADRNRQRGQGVFILDSNFITDSSVVGIHVQPGAVQGDGGVTHPGATINFPQLNQNRWVPGIVIQNNLIAGSSGIQFTGLDAGSVGPVPFGRIVNNTLVGPGGAGTGIDVGRFTSPTLLNNLLTGFATAIVNQGMGSIVRSNFFQNNASNGVVGTAAILAPAAAPLFLDPANRNYILQATSQAVDSSQNTEQDRLDFRNFKFEIGIPASPIHAPDRDIYGQLRVDSNAGPGGGGSQIYKDRGAIDRADRDKPYAVLLNPVDNDAFGNDQNPAGTIVHPTNSLLENFKILLGDGPGPQSPQQGTGVDGRTVDDPNDPGVAATAILITQNGVALTQGVDYTVGYNELTGELLLTPLSTLWDPRSVYTIKLNNHQITDKIGNRLRENQSDGATEFTIVMPDVQFDFGDAPTSYGTLLADNGARHTFTSSNLPRLGFLIDSENDGQPIDGDDQVGVDDEDGLLIGRMIDGTNSYLIFTTPGADPDNVQPHEVFGFLNPDDTRGANVSLLVAGTGFLDGWIDFNQNGVFDDGERVFDSLPVRGDSDDGSYVTLRVQTPVDALAGMTWMRIRISPLGGLSPTGIAFGGEVEDYPVQVHRFTTADPNEPPVFDITAPLDAGVPAIDHLEQDDFTPIVIEGFAENIFPGSPTALDETVTQSVVFSVTQAAGPTLLMSRLPVITANGTLTLFPVAHAVGSVVYTATLWDNHPTDPQSTSKTFVVNLRPVNDAPGLNPSTVPSSDTNPTDSEESYSVASDGTITYRLREDNTQPGGAAEPFFIPLHAATSGVFNRIGLMDVLTVGPTNESDSTLGGSQTLSLISPTTDHPNRIVGFKVQQLTDNNVIDEKPQISGDHVVWASGANSPPFTREIFFWDGITTTQVTNNTLTDSDPQISGHNVTWWAQTGPLANDREIFFWDGTVITQITNDSIRDEGPQISGSTVVWARGAGTDLEIYKWDGGSIENVSNSVGIGDSSPQIDRNKIVYKSGSSPSIAIWRNDGAINAPVSSLGFNKSNPQLDGDRVVWEQFAPGEDTEIYYFDGNQTIQLTNNDFNDFQPQISGQNIVWRGGTFPNIEIYMYDGLEIKQITNNRFTDFNPQIDGNIVVWQGSDGNDDEIFVWDGSQITQLTDNDYPDTVPQISGNQVVWQAQSKGSGDGTEIFHAELTLGYAATDQGGTLTPVFDGGELIGWNYTPPTDFNTANGGVDSFTYEVTDDGTSYDLSSNSLVDDPQTRINRVEFVLAPVNDPPVFDINAPWVAQVPTLNILEPNNATAITISNFALNIGPGPITAVDETASQQVTFSISEPNPTSGLMSQLPQLTSDGTLTLFPVANAVGSATFAVTLSDDHPTDPRSTTKTFTIHFQPINDRPGLNPSVVPSTATNPNNSDDSYSVASDGTITYRLREDNTQSAGLTEPFFIPLVASTSGGYNRIGLLDVFTVGPANEADDSPGGSQSLSMISPAVATTTHRGGTLTPVVGGWHYIPPADFNFLIGGVDWFSYEVGDNGSSYDSGSGSLVADPQTRTNRVELVLTPVNDAPLFDLSTDRIVVAEDSPQFSLANFATNISGGPVGTANDENDLASLQALTFTITPLDFAAEDMSAFFSNPLVLHSQTGRLSFRTAANVFGSYRFEVRLIDGGANDPDRGDVNQSDPQLLTIHVVAKNDPPMIQPSGSTVEYTLNEDGAVLIEISDLIDVFAPGPVTIFGDESVPGILGGNQTVSLADPIPTTTTAGGTLQLLTSGGPARLLYTPGVNFNGIDTFVYTVTDDGVTVGLDEVALDDPRTATQTVSLTVIPINDPPEFNLIGSVQSTEDAGPVSIADWATDVLAGPATATDETSGPSAQGLIFQFTQVGGDPNLIVPGSLSATIHPQTRRASLFYQSAPDANGTATFQVVLQDDGPSDTGNGDRNTSAPQTFTISVAAVNDPPSFTFLTNDPVSVAEDSGPQTVALLGNISPGPADEASQSVVFEVQPLAPQYASLFASLPTIDSDGVLRFTTAPNQNTGNINGPVPVRILARDSAGGQSDLVSFQIIVSEVNDPPVANPDSFDSDEDTVVILDISQLLANDVDPDLQTNASEVLRIQLAAQSLTSLGASLTYNEQTGQITYDPTEVVSIQAMTTGDSVTDSFTYSLIDAAGLTSDTVSVSFNIAGVNDAPILVADLAFLESEGSTSIDVLANDWDIDGSIDPTSLEIVGEPEFGTIVVTAEGVVLYTPKVDIPAQHSFTYTVADDLGLRSKPLTVMISTNPAPTTGDDFAGTFKGEPIFVNVVANDTDADGLDLASLVIVSGPARGQATAQSDGTVMYEPDAEFVGSDLFTYRISDTLGRPSRITTVNTQVVASRLQNPRNFADVNADGRVTAIDALLIINHLNRMGNVSEIPVLDSDRGPNYYDVSGNQVITALDALRVVNALRLQSVQLEAEGVADGPLSVASANRSESSESMIDAVVTDLARPDKIVSVAETAPISYDWIDTIARGKSTDDDDDAIEAAIDAAMSDLL